MNNENNKDSKLNNMQNLKQNFYLRLNIIRTRLVVLRNDLRTFKLGMNYLSPLMLAGLFLIVPNLSHANIFKCINKKGDVYYNDKPCPVTDKETKLKNIKDPKSKYIPKPFIEKKEVDEENKGIVVGKELQTEVESNKKKKDNNNEKQATDTTNNGNIKTKNTGEDKAKNYPVPPASFSMGNETKIPTVNELRALSGKSPLKKNERFEPSQEMEE